MADPPDYRREMIKNSIGRTFTRVKQELQNIGQTRTVNSGEKQANLFQNNMKLTEKQDLELKRILERYQAITMEVSRLEVLQEEIREGLDKTKKAMNKTLKDEEKLMKELRKTYPDINKNDIIRYAIQNGRDL